MFSALRAHHCVKYLESDVKTAKIQSFLSVISIKTRKTTLRSINVNKIRHTQPGYRNTAQCKRREEGKILAPFAVEM
jgi:hypothetical protein